MSNIKLYYNFEKTTFFIRLNMDGDEYINYFIITREIKMEL